jgi:hypothetical protein
VFRAEMVRAGAPSDVIVLAAGSALTRVRLTSYG